MWLLLVAGVFLVIRSLSPEFYYSVYLSEQSTTIETRFVLLLLRNKIMHPEQDQIWQFWWSSGGSGGFWQSEGIEGGHPGEVRRLRGVILAK